MTGGEWYWHVHHAVLVEQLTAPAQDEIETRLRLFKRVKDQGAVFAAQKARDEAVASAWKAYHEAVAPARKAYDEAVVVREAHDEAHEKECPDCPWDGRTIFLEKESK